MDDVFNKEHFEYAAGVPIRGAILIAIGNDARQDDGLGWAFAHAIEEQGTFPGAIEYRYQLQIEDADLIAEKEQVIFVDASKTQLPGGASFSRLEPALEFAFTTHALAPDAVLALCENVYGRCPEAWLLAIEGEAWELAFGLSAAGERHLIVALQSNFLEITSRG